MSASLTKADVARRIAETALLRGRFTLRSGRTSSYYLDKYLFSTQPDILRALGELFAERIAGLGGEAGGGEAVTKLAGAELGGIPLVSTASMASGIPCVFIRNRKKEYGTAKQLEGVLEAAATIAENGAAVVGIICTIDRQEGARETIEGAGYGFEALFTTADLGIEPEV